MPPRASSVARTALAPTTANAIPSKASTTSGVKRTASDANLDSGSNSNLRDSGIGSSNDPASIVDISSNDENASDSDGELYGAVIDKSCDQVRRQINTFIEAGGMKIGEFQNAIGVSSNAYLRFMRQHGKEKGAYTDTYQNAWAFFKKREMKGVPMPKKRKTSASKSTTGAPAKATSTSNSSSAPAPASTTPSKTIHDIHLPREEHDGVAIYDTCDEIRRKISAHLRKDGVTAAGFCRDLCSMYNTSRRPTKIQSKQLADFRGKSGPLSGNTSCVYYSSYVFFEKLRLLEGKPENKHRQEGMRQNPGGIDITRRVDYLWCGPNSRPHMNAYGRVSLY